MHDLNELKIRLQLIVEPLCAATGVDLVELNVREQQQEVMVQLLADLPNGGISLELCSDLNRKAVDAIIQSCALKEDEFSLELSSPGLDRPLKTRRDFLRVQDQEIRFILNGPLSGKQEHTGVSKEVQENAVIVETIKYGEITIPFAMIMKAVVVI